jgi:hypothetical protein
MSDLLLLDIYDILSILVYYRGFVSCFSTFVYSSILEGEDPISMSLPQVEVTLIGVTIVPGHQPPSFRLTIKDLDTKSESFLHL